MYAIVVTGGKQHRVQEGDLIRVEKLEGEVGSPVTLDHILMVAGDGDAQIGTPKLEGAKIEAEIIRQARGKKVLIFKKRRRKNYRRLNGHRQPFTHLRVNKIVVG